MVRFVCALICFGSRVTDLGLVPLFTGATQPAILVVPSAWALTPAQCVVLDNCETAPCEYNFKTCRLPGSGALSNITESSPSRVLTQRQLPG